MREHSPTSNKTSLDEWKHRLTRALPYVVGTAVVLAVALILVRLFDLLLALTLYSWFFGKIREYGGFPDLVSGAISIWLMALLLLSLPAVVSAIFFKKRRAIVLIAVLLSGWCVGLYFLSQPREGCYFNAITGTPWYKYARLPNGRVELFPLGYNYHPRYRIPLEPLTQPIAWEYENQRTVGSETAVKDVAEADKGATKERWLRIQSEPQSVPERTGAGLDMSVEGVGLVNGKTVLWLAVKSRPELEHEFLYPASGAYLIDSKGTRYDLEKDQGDYQRYDRGFLDWYFARVVGLHEVYRFGLVFPKLSDQTPYLHVNHPRFLSMRINLNWS